MKALILWTVQQIYIAADMEMLLGSELAEVMWKTAVKS